jgi:O-antigen/teichoic acid export membrane protein
MALVLLLLAETFGKYYIYHYLNVDSSRIDDSLYIFRLSVFSAIFSIVSIPFQALITAKENFFIRSVIEIVIALLKFIVVIVLFNYSGDKLLFFANLMLVVSLIGPAAYYLYSRIKYRELIKFRLYKDITIYKEFVFFSFWILFGAGASIGKIQGTAVVINSFFGTVLNASFGLANQLNTFVLIFAQNIGQAAIPQITKSFSSGDVERSKKLTASVSKYTFFLMLLPSLPLLLNTKYFLTIWLGILPLKIVIFTKLMVINALIDATVAGLPSAIQATGKIKYYQLILSSIILLALPVSYFCYLNNFAEESILWVFISFSLLNILISQYFIKYILNFKIVDYFNLVYKPILKMIILILPLFVFNILEANAFLWVIVNSIISIVIVLIGVYVFGLECNEKELLHQFFNKLKLKKI